MTENMITSSQAMYYIEKVKDKELSPVQAVKECRHDFSLSLAYTHDKLNSVCLNVYGKDLATLYNPP